MSHWQDPRLGRYKSAVQKYVRRGEVQAAVEAAEGLMRLPGGRGALARRLSAMTAEDVGIAWLPAVVAVTRSIRPGSGEAEDAALRSLTASLASLPKHREAYHLADTCWEGRRVARVASRAAMADALAAADHQEAMAIYLAARDGRRWRSGERVIEAVRAAARSAPPAAQAIIEAALWREGQGGAGSDECAAAAIIATIDRPRTDLWPLPVVAHDEPDAARPLDWFVFDAHTDIGRRALDRVARHRGLSPHVLAWLQFTYESTRVGPVEIPSRWRQAALDADARANGWGSPDGGYRLWEAVRDEIRDEIESRMLR